MKESPAPIVAYLLCVALAPIVVAGLGGRLYGFRKEWQIIILSYIFTPIFFLIIALSEISLLGHASLDYIGSIFDITYLLALFVIPLGLTVLHIRDPHKGS
ncbi:hypothetical protein [Aureimonas pseudogalii]|uniref:Low affinity Fe/Cu permease n=1 Tax=Aureimonas pseudogalii TaxID=1744844 RepID=A0A7W6H3R1_9HYPH|nr:hypothetical protein [Aureimonas pseudogalii]MBB3997985.1 low affinity Fe/Cu permease [Aureimonas pseudogalii]